MKPIAEAIAELMKEAVNNARERYQRDITNAREKGKRIAQYRPVLLRLEEAGFDLSVWNHGASASINLGFFPRTPAGSRKLAKKVREVRLILGCRLPLAGKNVWDAEKSHIQHVLCPEYYEHIKVLYTRKLLPDDRCKIKRERSNYASLVCEVS